MKKSIKKFEVKALNNSVTLKGGSYGRGTRSSATQSSNKAELL